MKSILPNSRKPDISFHASGKIDISAHIARRLSLAPGDVIDIAQEAGELYLYVKHRAGCYFGRHEGRVWATSRGKGTFRSSAISITRAVLAAAGVSDRLSCPCGAEIERSTNKYITIIYRHPL